MAITKTSSGMLITGESVNLYSFVMLRKAVEFRIKTGMSMLRNQEARMAKNYGWSNKRTMVGIKSDLDQIATSLGI